MPRDVADTMVEIAYAAHSILGDFADKIIVGGSKDGEWIAGKEAALDLAIVLAARDGLNRVTEEFGGAELAEAPFAGTEVDPEFVARAKFAARDAATGDTAPRAFQVEPAHASYFRVDDYVGGADVLQVAGHPLGVQSRHLMEWVDDESIRL
jgi:hypothetical protein